MNGRRGSDRIWEWTSIGFEFVILHDGKQPDERTNGRMDRQTDGQRDRISEWTSIGYKFGILHDGKSGVGMTGGQRWMNTYSITQINEYLGLLNSRYLL